MQSYNSCLKLHGFLKNVNDTSTATAGGRDVENQLVFGLYKYFNYGKQEIWHNLSYIPLTPEEL